MHVVVDCNSFFVSCEQIFRPDLEGRPVVVLSNNDGCVVARSPEAKKLGIPMGAPYYQYEEMFKRNRVVCFSANFRLYGDISQRVLSLLNKAAISAEPYSIDEAFLRLPDMPTQDYLMWGKQLRQQLLQWTGVPVSIGIAPSKTLAKAGTTIAKQDIFSEGVIYLPPNAIHLENRLKNLPVQEVWGIGWRLSAKMNNLGVRSVGDLAGISNAWMRSFSGVQGERTLRELKGQDVFGGRITYNEPAKYSTEATRSFSRAIYDMAELQAAVASFAVRTAFRIRQQNKLAQSVCTFITTGKHTQTRFRGSKQRQLPYPTDDTGMILEESLRALEEVYSPGYGYKRAGVALLGLTDKTAQQLPLLTPINEDFLHRRERLMFAFDSIRKKFGTNSLEYAVQKGGTRWHSKRQQISPSYTTDWLQLPKVKA